MIHNFYLENSAMEIYLKNFVKIFIIKKFVFIEWFHGIFFRFESSFEIFEFFWFLGHSRKSERLGHFEADDLSDS